MVNGRRKELQDLFDKLGEEGYNKVRKITRTNIAAEQRKQRRKDNPPTKEQKEKLALQNKRWRDKNKEKNKIRNKIYSASESGKKNKVLDGWKRQNINFGNTTPSEYYDNVFILTTCCNSCNKEFDKSLRKDKCLDHIHLDILFNIRGIICNACNMNDAWRYRMRPDSIYNIYVEQYDLFIMEKKREYNLEFD